MIVYLGPIDANESSVLFPCSCGWTARPHSLQHLPSIRRRISSVCTRRCVCVTVSTYLFEIVEDYGCVHVVYMVLSLPCVFCQASPDDRSSAQLNIASSAQMNLSPTPVEEHSTKETERDKNGTPLLQYLHFRNTHTLASVCPCRLCPQLFLSSGNTEGPSVDVLSMSPKEALGKRTKRLCPRD